MRRVSLTVFFCLAACGGAVPSTSGAVDRTSSQRGINGDRMAFLMSPDGSAVVASFVGSVSQEALDGCIDSWLGDEAPEPMPAQKPSAVALRAFLAQCLSRPEPGGLHADPGAGLRIVKDTGI
jgi:hypothetical protein